MIRIEKETIAIVVSEVQGMVKSTAYADVNSFRCGSSGEFLRWQTYLGHDKDQSPTGYGVILYEPHPKFPGLFQRHEILNHWDGPMDEEHISLVMQVVCLQFTWRMPGSNDGLQKEHIGRFLRRVLNATYPTAEEKKSAEDTAQEKEAAHTEIRRLLEARQTDEALALAADHGYVVAQQGEMYEVYPAQSK